MRDITRALFVGAATALVAIYSSSTLAAPACDKACLESIADQYRAAYARRDATALPLAKRVTFSENGVKMPFPEASWDTITREAGPSTTISDVKTGQVGIYTAILQNDTPGFIAIRLQVKGGRITEIEHILSTKRNLSGPPTPIGEIDAYKPDPNLTAIVPVEKRLPRERLLAHATGYFDTLQNNTGEIRGTRFTPDATRIENGRLYTEIEKGFKRGYYRFNERVRREHLLVDEERQVVMSRGFIDHKGLLDTYVTTDGEKIRSIYREPHTWGFLEMFKINDDKITGVQAVFIQVPYNMGSPWKK
jgi:hypothetical protein